jgi:type I restriction enzyme M protein
MSGKDILAEILKDSKHSLTIFTQDQITALNDRVLSKVINGKEKPYVKCLIREKNILLKPEEIVRQLYISKLIDEYGYAKDRIALEKKVYFGSSVHEKAADIVVSGKDNPDAYIIVECKKPERKDGRQQLESYCNAEGSPIGVWTNGGDILYLHRKEPNIFQSLTNIPPADQLFSTFTAERWDLQRLIQEDKLAKEGVSLRDVILDMQELVLANAGVDAFDEVFKLIYCKLYDESSAARGKKKKYLEFNVYNSPAYEYYERISNLFDKAKKKWPGVFFADEKINLTPHHLLTCGSFLEDKKLFNSNLNVIDDAFEYLSVEVSKGNKGQYFTPRYVIDMCVKMLNPKDEEYMIDTAAGSCGFTVHTIFKVWGNQFTAEEPKAWQKEYASEYVYAIDFDTRSVKIAKAMNLIAGDGRTNVYRANSLDTRHWDDEVKVGLRNRLRKFPEDRSTDEYNQKHYIYFDFDVLMTNPPFAGDIKDQQIIQNYDLGKKANGKLQNKTGRDVLFIERNLDFLRPGGRMAIVLPQGRFNNKSDKIIRDYISDKARILAVVGLGQNTFKPHTGTKTSVLFLQKWNDDPIVGPMCPKVDDYSIFFAVSEKSGKDNSGEYINVREGGKNKLDKHRHLIVDHDLHNHWDELEGGIAEAFIDFARKEKLSFWMEG